VRNYNCHAEKRGPMLWEHQPVREDCMNCHTPHGSTQQRLVKEQMNFLCSSCHSASAANHSGGAVGGRSAIPFRGPGNFATNSALANQRACIGCHSQVHGSNSPSGTYFFR
jgi:DmsE family decaheme c-type cytochrome